MGGDEVCIFVEDVFRMYMMYFKEMGWKYEIINFFEGGMKGYKEIFMNVEGVGIYGMFKFELGVYWVQCVLEMELQGCVYILVIIVVVFLEVEEVDFEFDMNDVCKDIFWVFGVGGQYINKIEFVICLMYILIGVVVECQDGCFQYKNFEKVIFVLCLCFYQVELDRVYNECVVQWKIFVLIGDCFVKICIYNYLQGCIIDYCINKIMYNFGVFMNGDIQEMIDVLKMVENVEKMKGEIL